MENKEQHEISFWQDFIKGKDFKEFRNSQDNWKIDEFPELRDRDGSGIDVGSGPLSVFEDTKNNIIAIDPLMDEYKKIYKEETRIKHIKASGEELPFKDKEFDYSYCCNVIDHTPNPEKMVSELARVSKKIYLQVNFDDQLSECHYGLWNEELVNKMFPYKQVFKKITEGQNQKLFWAIYEV